MQKMLPSQDSESSPKIPQRKKDWDNSPELWKQFDWIPDANRVQLMFMSNLSYPQMGCKSLFSLAIFLSVALVVFLQLLSHVWFVVTPWTVACHASLSFTISWTLLKFTSVESVMLSNHLILCHSLLRLSPIFSRIRAFSNESALHIKL